jgi:hypothetical protein
LVLSNAKSRTKKIAADLPRRTDGLEMEDRFVRGEVVREAFEDLAASQSNDHPVAYHRT